MRGEQAAVAGRPGLVLCLQHDCTRAVAEQHTGAAIIPVEDARKRLGTDH